MVTRADRLGRLTASGAGADTMGPADGAGAGTVDFPDGGAVIEHRLQTADD